MKIDDTEYLYLEQYHVYAARTFPKILLEARLDFTPVLDNMMATISGYVWGEVTQDVTIAYPENWKEAFKERWFTGWLRRRYPIKRKVHTIKVTAVAPNIRKAFPAEPFVWHVDKSMEVEDETD